MIVIGYQGIGKSTIGKRLGAVSGFIDLESSLFKNEVGFRCPDWHEVYCKIALSLSEQGYTVFISSHKVIQDYLKCFGKSVLVIYPSLDIRDDWINKLYARYTSDKSRKNEAAWLNAMANFEKDIKALSESPFTKYEIKSMDYRLMDILNHETEALSKCEVKEKQQPIQEPETYID